MIALFVYFTLLVLAASQSQLPFKIIVDQNLVEKPSLNIPLADGGFQIPEVYNIQYKCDHGNIIIIFERNADISIYRIWTILCIDSRNENAYDDGLYREYISVYV